MSLLMNEPVMRKSPALFVPFESYLYLQDKCCLERSGKHLSKKARQRLTRNFEQFAFDGKKKLKNGDLGGCNGDPENAWEEGRWTSWSVDDIAKILDEAGLPWSKSDDVEYIVV